MALLMRYAYRVLLAKLLYDTSCGPECVLIKEVTLFQRLGSVLTREVSLNSEIINREAPLHDCSTKSHM